MQLHLHEVVAGPRHVEHDAGGLIELHDRPDFERRVRRDRIDELAGEIVAGSSCEKPLRSDVQMKRLLSARYRIAGELLTQPVGHSSRTTTRHLPVVGTARGQFHDVLAAIRAVQQQLRAVRRPADVVGVVPDVVVRERRSVSRNIGEGLAVANVDLRRAIRRRRRRRRLRRSDSARRPWDRPRRRASSGPTSASSADRSPSPGSRRSGSTRPCVLSGDHQIAVV